MFENDGKLKAQFGLRYSDIDSRQQTDTEKSGRQSADQTRAHAHGGPFLRCADQLPALGTNFIATPFMQ